jgi:SAM-dependent methyltransferase
MVQSPVPVPIVDHIAHRVTITVVLLALAVVVDRPFAAAHHQTGRGTQAPARLPDIFFAPTLYSVADDMLKLAQVTAQDVVYDLGSGDGRVLLIAAQKYGARGVGVEIDHRLVELSRQIAREGEVSDRLTFIEGDLFETDLSPATVVTLYLSPTVNKRLEPKLRAQLRPGARIVSHQFGIGTWTPDKVIRAEGDRTELFLWTVPAR